MTTGGSEFGERARYHSRFHGSLTATKQSKNLVPLFCPCYNDAATKFTGSRYVPKRTTCKTVHL